MDVLVFRTLNGISMRQGQKIAWSPLWSNTAQRELCGESSTTLHLEGKELPDEG
mgnify:CR=1 FL=1